MRLQTVVANKLLPVTLQHYEMRLQLLQRIISIWPLLVPIPKLKITL